MGDRLGAGLICLIRHSCPRRSATAQKLGGNSCQEAQIDICQKPWNNQEEQC